MDVFSKFSQKLSELVVLFGANGAVACPAQIPGRNRVDIAGKFHDGTEFIRIFDLVQVKPKEITWIFIILQKFVNSILPLFTNQAAREKVELERCSFCKFKCILFLAF